MVACVVERVEVDGRDGGDRGGQIGASVFVRALQRRRERRADRLGTARLACVSPAAAARYGRVDGRHRLTHVWIQIDHFVT